MAATKDRLVSPTIESGRVIDVDVENYTVSVVTQFTQKALSGLGWATPYQHFENGEGFYAMPEVGSLVWICFPSDNSKPFVMAWAPAREENGSLRSRKKDLNPGDIFLGGRDENFLILRRGGVVQVGAGPLSQRMFIPVSNIIRDFCENYELRTLGGDLEWTVDREEATTDGRRPGRLRLKAREFADDQEPVGVLEFGSHSDNSANILSLVIRASGEKGAAKRISLEFRKDGGADWKYEGSVEWTVKETLSVTAKSLSLSGTETAQLEGGEVTVEATQGDLALKANGRVTTTTLYAGGGSNPVFVLTPSAMAWLLSHTHPIPGGSPVSGPPEPPDSQDFVSKSIFGQ